MRRSLACSSLCLGSVAGLLMLGCTSLTSPPETEVDPKQVAPALANAATPSPSPSPSPTLIPVAAPPPRPAEERVSASHILVAYKGSRSSASATRTKEQAKARAEEALKKAKSGADFAALARTYSDDPGSGPKGGELGSFARGAMVKPFADATFALKPGELSGIVETDFGFHIIKRTQ